MLLSLVWLLGFSLVLPQVFANPAGVALSAVVGIVVILPWRSLCKRGYPRRTMLWLAINYWLALAVIASLAQRPAPIILPMLGNTALPLFFPSRTSSDFVLMFIALYTLLLPLPTLHRALTAANRRMLDFAQVSADRNSETDATHRHTEIWGPGLMQEEMSLRIGRTP